MKKCLMMLVLTSVVLPVYVEARVWMTPTRLAAFQSPDCQLIKEVIMQKKPYRRLEEGGCGLPSSEPADAYPKQWLESLSPSTQFAIIRRQFIAFSEMIPASVEDQLVYGSASVIAEALASREAYQDPSVPNRVIARTTLFELRACWFDDLEWHEWLFASRKPQWCASAIAGAEICGRRESMQDSIAVERNERYLVLGVFDGHGGTARVADYLSSCFASSLLGAGGTGAISDQQLLDVYRETDRYILNHLCCGHCSVRTPNHCAYPYLVARGGSTAVVAMVDTQLDELIMINLGDSRMLLVGDDGEVLAATVDHVPSDPAEKDRIETAGGFVSPDGLLDGTFPLSRAFGDFSLKPLINPEAVTEYGRPDVTGERWYHIGIEPTITRMPLPDKGFLVLACDGLWDVATNAAVGRYVADATLQGASVETIATTLVRAAYEGPTTEHNELRPLVSAPSGDNISVMVASIAQLREKGLLAKK